MSKRDISLAIMLITIGVMTRTLLHIGPNFEFVTAVTIMAAAKLRPPYSIAVPMFTLLVSDLLLGNSVIFVFTWSGFLFTFVLAWLAKKQLNSANNFWRHILKYEVLAIVGVLAFYLWTNLGVTITTTMYPDTLQGYTQSLIMALPFLKHQLLSAMLTTGLLSVVWEIIARQSKLQNRILHIAN